MGRARLSSRCKTAILLLVSAAALAQAPSIVNPPAVPIRLRAKVLSIVDIQSFRGKLITATFDPRFAVTMRIESVNPKIKEMARDAVVTFGIHSPALTFLTDEPKGRTFGLCLRREGVNGSAKFSGFTRVSAEGVCTGWAR